MIDVMSIEAGKAALCRSVLDDLPEWFGMAEAKLRYVSSAAAHPMLGCRLDGVTAGFASLRPRTAAAVEIEVMGVYRRFHRRGIGRVLVDGAIDWARGGGYRFLTLKTLAPDHPDPHYAQTRRFYEAVGFLPLEVFPMLWDEGNPCLLMVRPLD